jgi:hypothetical protein
VQQCTFIGKTFGLFSVFDYFSRFLVYSPSAVPLFSRQSSWLVAAPGLFLIAKLISQLLVNSFVSAKKL